MKRFLIGTLAAAAALAFAPLALAQGPWVVLDQHSIDNTNTSPWWYCASDTTVSTLGTPHGWTADDVNDDDNPNPAKRDVLKFFSSLTFVASICGDADGVVDPNENLDIWIPTGGSASDPGWIQLNSIPDGTPPAESPDWVQSPPHDYTDGWRNFFTAEEGLGSPGPSCSGSGPKILKHDGSCDSGPEVLLDKVPDTHRVGVNDATGVIDDTEWNALFDQLVCSPVHDSDVSQDPSKGQANLQGNYLGVIGITPREIRDHPSHAYPLLRVTIGSTSNCFAVLAVKFQTLRATRYGRSVTLRWTTATELDTLGYNVFRSVRGKRIKMTKRLIPASSLVSGGIGPFRYAFRARLTSARAAAQSRYWIQEIELDGTWNWYGPVRATSAT